VKRDWAGARARVRVRKKKPTVKVRRTRAIKPVEHVVESKKMYSRKRRKQQSRKEIIEND
jgi:hypothetical protein